MSEERISDHHALVRIIGAMIADATVVIGSAVHVGFLTGSTWQIVVDLDTSRTVGEIARQVVAGLLHKRPAEVIMTACQKAFDSVAEIVSKGEIVVIEPDMGHGTYTISVSAPDGADYRHTHSSYYPDGQTVSDEDHTRLVRSLTEDLARMALWQRAT